MEFKPAVRVPDGYYEPGMVGREVDQMLADNPFYLAQQVRDKQEQSQKPQPQPQPEKKGFFNWLPMLVMSIETQAIPSASKRFFTRTRRLDLPI